MLQRGGLAEWALALEPAHHVVRMDQPDSSGGQMDIRSGATNSKARPAVNIEISSNALSRLTPMLPVQGNPRHRPTMAIKNRIRVHSKQQIWCCSKSMRERIVVVPQAMILRHLNDRQHQRRTCKCVMRNQWWQMRSRMIFGLRWCVGALKSKRQAIPSLPDRCLGVLLDRSAIPGGVAFC